MLRWKRVRASVFAVASFSRKVSGAGSQLTQHTVGALQVSQSNAGREQRCTHRVCRSQVDSNDFCKTRQSEPRPLPGTLQQLPLLTDAELQGTTIRCQHHDCGEEQREGRLASSFVWARAGDATRRAQRSASSPIMRTAAPCERAIATAFNCL